MTNRDPSIILTLFVVPVLLSNLCLAQQCWVYQRDNVSDAIKGICFTDSLTGAAVGDGGAIVQTKDGGKNWIHRITIPGSVLYGVSFSNGNVGVAVGEYPVTHAIGLIFHTTNGGASWPSQEFNRSIYGVSLTDSNVGIAVGSWGTILLTTDGGSSWVDRSFGSNYSYLSVSCINPRVATVVGEHGTIFRTTNAGITWQQQQSNTDETLRKVFFVDANHGTVVSTGGSVLCTTDGGVTWARQHIAASLSDVSFADTNNGIIVGRSNIYRTTNGGTTWDTTAVPAQLYSVVLRTSNINAPTVGISDGIIATADNCFPYPEITRVFPPDSAEHQALLPVGAASLKLLWNCLPTFQAKNSRVQVASDSSFVSSMIVDTIVALNRSYVNTSLVLSKLVPGAKYFWRVRIEFFDSTVTDWSKIWRFTTAKGVISGKVFNDLNRNGGQDTSEPGLVPWVIDLSGSVQATVYTDSNGTFSFWGIDSGHYVITQRLPASWVSTVPNGESYSVSLGVNDTVSGKVFGNYFPWNSISGTLFDDRNENGVQDNGDPGLANWVIRLQSGTVDSVRTDSSGHFVFPHLGLYSYSLSVAAQPSWEQIAPQLQGGGYGFYFNQYDQHISSQDFAVHRIPTRVKLTLHVKDNRPFIGRDIWFGVRPGATFGIWGADSASNNVDFSEGEFDLPQQLYGLFDARFVTPRPFNSQFGYGSWTDMRPFTSSTQIDTFKVSFRPGYYYGGDYPFGLSWSQNEIIANYNGPVTLVDPLGGVTDMKSIDYVIVSDPSIAEVLIIARDPKIPASYLMGWQLISLSSQVDDRRLSILYPHAGSKAFSYNPEGGYQADSVLTTGVGYWLLYAKWQNPDTMVGTPLMKDTLEVKKGWNMIGTIGVSVDVRTIGTVPEGIILGKFFAYQVGQYAEVDTLMPNHGYWVKVRQDGQIVLSSGSPTAMKNNGEAVQRIQDFNELLVQDASGDKRVLYFGSSSKEGLGLQEEYSLPPLPPEGVFDMRYGTGSMLELVEYGKSKETHINLTSAVYPVTVRWKVKPASAISAVLKVQGKEIPLRTAEGVTTIADASGQIVMELNGVDDVPKEFLLEQNYPNPFNPSTVIRYQLPVESWVKLRVYDVLGREVRTLVDGIQMSGFKSIELNASELASGVYFYRMEATNVNNSDNVFIDVKKLLLLK